MAYREKNLIGSISTSGLSANLDRTVQIIGSLNQADRVIEKDYEKLENKPSINGVELMKNKSLEELGYSPLTNSEILSLIKMAKGGI